MSSSLAVPVFLWGPRPPSHKIKLLCLLPDNATLVTATAEGQIGLWHGTRPLTMIFPDPLAPITALGPADVDPASTLFVSANASGLVALWDARDGRCVEAAAGQAIHTAIRPQKLKGGRPGRQVRLFCAGHYAEVLVLDPSSLETIAVLGSRVEPDWILAFSVLSPPSRPQILVGLSGSRMVKIWALTELESKDISLPGSSASLAPLYESESKQMECGEARQLSPCRMNQRAMVLCAPREWSVFDAGDLSVLVAQPSPAPHVLWLGAVFLHIDKVLAYASDGTAYLYQLPRKKDCISSAILGEAASGAPPFDKSFCYCRLVLDPAVERPLSAPPVFLFSEGPDPPNTPRLIRGDREGRLVLWHVPLVSDRQIAALTQEQFDKPPEVKANHVNSLAAVWDALPHRPGGVLGHVKDSAPLTATLWIGSQGRLVLGRADGLVLLLSGVDAVSRELLTNAAKPPDWPAPRFLDGHGGEAVRALLYPHEESERYDPALLLSGGDDFAVCVWDLKSGTRQARYCVQAGPILGLSVPPPASSPRVLQSICSVAGDHSVALIGLKEQKVLLLASRHVYAVKRLLWRPLEDFLVVECEDASVFVWQCETGHLERVASGLEAEEIVAGSEEAAAAAEEAAPVAEGGEGGEAGASQAVQMIRAIKHRNVAAIKRVAALGEKAEAKLEAGIDLALIPPPMEMREVRAAPEDAHAHVVLFHVEALIIRLLAEEQALSVSASSSSGSLSSAADGQQASPSLSGLLAKAKEKAEAALRSPSAPRKGTAAEKKASAAMATLDGSLAMDVAGLLMSLLHGWGLDADLDKVCLGKLGLLFPRGAGLPFGLLSRNGALAVRMPSALAPPPADPPAPAAPFVAFSTRLHWQISPSLTTQHLLTLIGTANTLMSMSSAGFLPDQERRRRLAKRLSIQGGSAAPSQSEAEASGEGSQIKQGWSLLAALHCVLLPELVKAGPLPYQPPRIELLARRWQERCLELREAAQALLLRELNRLGPAGRKALVDAWAPFLPSNLDPSLSIFGSSRPLGAQPGQAPPPPGPSHSHPSAAAPAHPTTPGSHSAPVVSPANHPPLLSSHAGKESQVVKEAVPGSESSIQAVRRNQATAVVVLGVIGAEFGEEMSGGTGAAQAAAPQGFTAGDHSLARGTGGALLELLVQPPSALLPAFSPLRRAAMDLLGRGFVVWEPYLDISKVLLGLLDLAAPADRLLPAASALQLPLSPVADAARTARHSLALIATARPPAVITALSREVARHNASAAQGALHPASSPLVKARPEILRLLHLLTEKQYSHVLHLLIAVGEILVHCLDTSLLKTQSLADVFPPIAKFYQASYCPSSRRLAFGSPTGQIALHELRASKAQTIQAHSKAVTAVAFSEDGKHLASYSADEGKVNFWTATGSFLGIGASQIKCVKQVPAPSSFPVQSPGGSPALFRARLVWVGPKALTLLLPNGKEHRFAI